MLPIANYENFEDGQVIIEEGTHGDWLYEIDSGSVELSRMVKGRKVVIDILKEGDTFGELAFIAHVPRTATALAIGKTTVGIVDRTFLDDQFNKLSQDFQAILRTLALRLKKATDVLTDINK